MNLKKLFLPLVAVLALIVAPAPRLAAQGLGWVQPNEAGYSMVYPVTNTTGNGNSTNLYWVDLAQGRQFLSPTPSPMQF